MMKKMITLLLALTLPVFAYAQETTLNGEVLEVPPRDIDLQAEMDAEALGLTVNQDGTVVLGVDVLTAMANDNVQAALKEAAEKTGNAAWYAKVFPLVWGAVTVPAVAVKEQVVTTAEYATETPLKFFKTALVGGTAYLASQGDLNDLTDDIAEAFGWSSGDDDSPKKADEGVVATRGSRVDIKDADTVPTNIRADEGSVITIDRSTGGF